MKIQLTLALFFIFLTLGANATTYTSAANGAWTTTTNWSPNGTPGDGDIIIINHAITRAATSFTWWTASNSITINSGGSLAFSGNATFAGSGINIYVKTGGSMSITGTLTLNNQSEIIMQGGTLTSSGAFTVDGGVFSSTSGSSVTVASLATTSNGSTSFSNSGTLTTSGSGNVDFGGAMTNNGTMNIGGSLNGASTTFTNNGVLTISGSVDLPSSSKLFVNPGAVVTVAQHVTTRANQNLVVGTTANPPPYADFIIKGNLVSSGSGDILVDKNGRLAVFGNFSTSGGGGAIFTVNDGGLVYINGTMSFTGNGDHLTNNNDGVPYGFYSNNTPTFTGGGGSSNGAAGANSVQNVSTMQTDAPAFYTWVAAITGSPLPVELLYFNGKQLGDEIKLVWATASQLNFNYFAIESSINGEEWREEGRVVGEGTSQALLTYEYVLRNFITGKNYFRLKSVDFDETYEYSNIVAVVASIPAHVSVYPNPASSSQSLSFELNFNPQEGDYFRLLDVSGVELLRQSISTLTGSLNLPTLLPGIYFIHYQGTNYTTTQRLLVR